MDEFRQYLSSFFAHRDAAEGALARRIEWRTSHAQQAAIAREIIGNAVGKFPDVASQGAV